MNRRYAITTLAALGLVAAGSLFATAASAEDTMKPGHMKSEGMKADKMKSGHMKSGGMDADKMKSGHMKSDAIKSGHMGGTQK